MAGAPDNDEAVAPQPRSERRPASTSAMHLIGLGRRSSGVSGGGTSALKYVGLGKRPNAIRYIGLGKRTPDRSACYGIMYYFNGWNYFPPILLVSSSPSSSSSSSQVFLKWTKQQCHPDDHSFKLSIEKLILVHF